MSRSLRLAVAWATLALAGVMLLWTTLTPGFRGADEPAHVSTAIRLAIGGGYPPPGEAQLDLAVRAAGPAVGWPGLEMWDQTGPVGLATVDPGQPATVPGMTMADLRAPDLPRDAQTVDWMTQHPPAYSAYLAAVYQVFDGESRTPAQVLIMFRLASILLLIPVPYLCAAGARLVGLGELAAGAAAFIPVAWMQFAVIGGSVTNGTMLVAATSIVVWLLLKVMGGDLRLSIAFSVGLMTSLALLTKGFALTLLPLLAWAYLVAAGRSSWRSTLRPAVVAAVLCLPGLAWWARNVVLYGSIQPWVENYSLSNPDRSLARFASEFGLTLSWTNWIALGWNETPLPVVLHLPATAALIAVTAWGTWKLRTRWPELVVLHGSWLLSLIVVVAGGWSLYSVTGRVVGPTGRYLLSGTICLAVVVVAALAPYQRLLSVFPLLAGLAAAAAALFGLRHFWLPVDSLSAIATVAGRWPGGWWLIGIGTVAAGVGCLGGGHVLWRGLRLADEPDPELENHLEPPAPVTRVAQ